jgi:hypothetical protein
VAAALTGRRTGRAGRRTAAAHRPRARRLTKPAAATIRQLWRSWVTTTLLDEFNRVDQIKGQRAANVLTSVKTRRKAVATALVACPREEWIRSDGRPPDRLWPRRMSLRHDEGLRSGLFHPAAQPLQLDRRVAFAAGDEVEQFVVAGALRRLADDRPADVALGSHEVQVLQVAQQPDAAGAGAAEQLGVQPVRLLGCLLGVPLGERLQAFREGWTSCL